jgi:hypothetical protein
MTKLSELERKILNVCCGGIEQLPYSDMARMNAAKKRLRNLGLIESGYEDDQPTSWPTDAGRAALDG